MIENKHPKIDSIDQIAKGVVISPPQFKRRVKKVTRQLAF